MRLNKLLALRLQISRRAADKLIEAGRITSHGEVTRLGIDVDNDDEDIRFDDRPLPPVVDLTYVLLNKPVGYVCSRRGQGSQTIYDLLPLDCQKLNPVGRLDKDSSGLMLLTNDGALHNKLTHPKFQKNKTYQVVLDKPLSTDHIKAIESGGVTLDDGVSRFSIKPSSNKPAELEAVLKEGRNRQVRRTFEALGYQVKILHRTQFGQYQIGNLRPGKTLIVNK